jgi:hypothetical protein
MRSVSEKPVSRSFRPIKPHQESFSSPSGDGVKGRRQEGIVFSRFEGVVTSLRRIAGFGEPSRPVPAPRLPACGAGTGRRTSLGPGRRRPRRSRAQTAPPHFSVSVLRANARRLNVCSSCLPSGICLAEIDPRQATDGSARDNRRGRWGVWTA